ncbi:MAG: tol-pal system protein YbgF [Nitrospirota bacterium]
MRFGNADGSAAVRRRFGVGGRGRFLGLAGALLLGAAGCATQAALVDVQTDVETMRGQVDRMAQQMGGLDKVLQDRSTSGQRSQVDLVVRLDQLAADLQTVQGRIEEQAHRMAEISAALDDQAFRLNQMSARVDTTDARLTEQERRASGGAPPAPGSMASVEPPSDQERVVLPGRTPMSGLSPVEAYNLAYNDFIKGSYDLAIQGFQAFLKQYPTSILVPHAVYWLGESYYQTKQYPQAVEQYERLITQFPKNEKLVGALLKQGFAYAAINDKNKARAALKRVLEEFPRASEANLAKEKLAELR